MMSHKSLYFLEFFTLSSFCFSDWVLSNDWSLSSLILLFWSAIKHLSCILQLSGYSFQIQQSYETPFSPTLFVTREVGVRTTGEVVLCWVGINWFQITMKRQLMEGKVNFGSSFLRHFILSCWVGHSGVHSGKNVEWQLVPTKTEKIKIEWIGQNQEQLSPPKAQT